MRVFVPGTAEEGARDPLPARGARGRADSPPAAERADARRRLRPRGGGGVADADSRSGLSPLPRHRARRSARRWQVITRAGVRTVLAKRTLHRRCCCSPGRRSSSAPCRSTSPPTSQQASFLAPKAETFREFLGQQGIFVFFVTIYVGAGLIANDRRANALQVYLSKPLTRAEYVAGKLAILFLFLVGVTWLPAICCCWCRSCSRAASRSSARTSS